MCFSGFASGEDLVVWTAKQSCALVILGLVVAVRKCAAQAVFHLQGKALYVGRLVPSLADSTYTCI